MMKITDFDGKRICVLGYGREGRATVEALEKYAPDVEITIADQNPNIRIQNAKHATQLGEQWLDDLDRFDVIIKSPGIPPNSTLIAHSAKLTSSTQIFLDLATAAGAVTIGVTGSKGKSTTASLIHAMLRAQNPDSGSEIFLVGNIGDAAIAHIADAKRDAIFVIEMSSYQLMDLKTAPHVAVITSFFPEHLDYHASTALGTGSALEEYRKAKAKITTLQNEGDIVFYADTESVRPMIANTKAKKVPVTANGSPVTLSETKLIGNHNLGNIALATAVARHFGVSDAVIVQAIKNFTPLPHRLQSLGVHGGIEWIDDAISTTPESAMAAMAALGNNVKAIILGGQDRGNDFTELGRAIDASAIELVILLGQSGLRISKSIKTKKMIPVYVMNEAISTITQELKNLGTQQPIALLSPASPSYDMYENFEAKGDDFQKTISRVTMNE